MKKNFNSALILTAAALTLSAAAAYGQTKVTAEIPFAFRTAGGVQPAGVYDLISISPNHAMLALRSVATLKAVPLGFGAPEGSSAGWYGAQPRLVFHCSDANGCVLSAVFIEDGRGWSYRTPHVKPSELERVAVVYLGRSAGGQ